MITFLPYILLKIFPDLKIEQLLLWLPVCVAGFVCIPIVLIGRLYGSSLWGFLSACLAGITHSYYNRTLAGYYDTDMFFHYRSCFCYVFPACSIKERVNRIFISGYHKFILIWILLWICSSNYLCFSPDFFGLSMGVIFTRFFDFK